MRLKLELTVDLGDQATRVEELADMATLVEALRETVIWHGRPIRLVVREGMYLGRNLWGFADRVATLEGAQLHGVREHVDALAGVEWGGK